MHEPLEIDWIWDRTKDDEGANGGKWQPAYVSGPYCHGHDMLILGEPKVDKHGLRSYGLIIDPLDDMRCPRILAA